MILSRSSCKMNLRGSSLEIVQFNLALSALLFLSPNSAVLVFRRRVLNTGIKPPAAPIIELLERNKMKPRAKIALLVLLTLGGVMPLSIYFTVPAAHGLVTVKTDGQYIYTVSNNTVAIVDAYPTINARLLSRISLVNQTIDGIFVEGDRLSVVSEAPRNPYSGGVYCGPLTMRTSQMP